MGHLVVGSTIVLLYPKSHEHPSAIEYVDRNVCFKMLSMFVLSYYHVVMVTCERTDQSYPFMASVHHGISEEDIVPVLFFLGNKWISRPPVLDTDSI